VQRRPKLIELARQTEQSLIVDVGPARARLVQASDLRALAGTNGLRSEGTLPGVARGHRGGALGRRRPFMRRWTGAALNAYADKLDEGRAPDRRSRFTRGGASEKRKTRLRDAHIAYSPREEFMNKLMIPAALAAAGMGGCGSMVANAAARVSRTKRYFHDAARERTRHAEVGLQSVTMAAGRRQPSFHRHPRRAMDRRPGGRSHLHHQGTAAARAQGRR